MEKSIAKVKTIKKNDDPVTMLDLTKENLESGKLNHHPLTVTVDVEVKSEAAENENQSKVSRELKSLIDSAKESKIISESTQIKTKMRKSRGLDSSQSSINTSVEAATIKDIRRNSSNSQKSTCSDSSDKSIQKLQRSMRSNNPEFVVKQKKFLDFVSGREQRKENKESQDGSEFSDKSDSMEIDMPSKRRIDPYCWRCHWEVDPQTENELLHPPWRCTVCPRSFHAKCVTGTAIKTSTHDSWVCIECMNILQAENAETRSPSMKRISFNTLCDLFKYALQRMMAVNGVEPFLQPVDRQEFPQYDEFVVHPVDLSTIQQNINAGLYGSTEAFLSDAMWILHNSIIFNSLQSKLTSGARALVRCCRNEMNEIEACPECYAAANRRKPNWFTDICSIPHLPLWARLRGHPYWPAKAMSYNPSSGLVDVRFFGQHDRAWVPFKDCFLYSKDDPNNYKNKRHDIEISIEEAEQYIRNITRVYGTFISAPSRTIYNPLKEEEQLKLMIPGFTGEVNRPYQKFSNCSSPAVKSNTPKSMKSTEHNTEENQNEIMSDEELPLSRSVSRKGSRDTDEMNPVTLNHSAIKRRKSQESESSETGDVSSTGNNRKRKLALELPESAGEHVKLDDGHDLKKPKADDETLSTSVEEMDSVKSADKQNEQLIDSENPEHVNKKGSSLTKVVHETRRQSMSRSPKKHSAEETSKLTPTQNESGSVAKPLEINEKESEKNDKLVENTENDSKNVEKNKEFNNKENIEKVSDKGENSGVENTKPSEDSSHEQKDKIPDTTEISPTVIENASSQNKLNPPVNETPCQIIEANPEIKEKKTENNQKLPDIQEKSDNIKEKSEATKIDYVQNKVNKEIPPEETNNKPSNDKSSDDNNKKSQEPKEMMQSRLRACRKSEPNKKTRRPRNSNRTSRNTQFKDSQNMQMPTITRVQSLASPEVFRMSGSETSLSEAKAKLEKLRDIPSISVKSFARDPALSQNTNTRNKNKETEKIICTPIIIKTEPPDTDNTAEKEDLMNSLQLIPTTSNAARNTSSVISAQTLKQFKLCQYQNQNSLPKSAIKIVRLAEKRNAKDDINEQANKQMEPSKETQNSSPPRDEETVSDKPKARKTFPTPKRSVEDNRSELNSKNSMVYIPIQPPLVPRPAQYGNKNTAVTSSSIVETTTSIQQQQAPPLMTSDGLLQQQTNISPSTPLSTTVSAISLSPSPPVAPSVSFSLPQSLFQTLPMCSTSLPYLMGFNGRAMVSGVNGQAVHYASQVTSTTMVNSTVTTPSTSTMPVNIPPLPPLQQHTLLHPLDPNTPIESMPTPSSAGPATAILNQNAVKLTDFFRKLLVESLDKMDDSSATVESLKLQLEAAKWKHQQELAELKHNTDLLINEIVNSFEKVKAAAISDVRRTCEQETRLAVDNAKMKQWCAYCRQEAQFYCCWNTSYCDYSCQQRHWPQHFSSCKQNSGKNSKDKIASMRAYQARGGNKSPVYVSISSSVGTTVKYVTTQPQRGMVMNHQLSDDSSKVNALGTGGGFLIVGTDTETGRAAFLAPSNLMNNSC